MRIISLMALTILCIGCSQTQLFYLRNAELAKSFEGPEYAFLKSRPESIRMLLNGHYVKPGKNLVLLIRRFDRGKLFTIDDEIYEKLTIQIRSFKTGVPISLDSNDISFYYSSGASGFIYKGHGVFSEHGSGEITIRDIENNRIVADIDFSILAKPAGPFPFEDKRIQIRDSFIFRGKRINDLTPWLGLPDPNPGKEVYP